MVCTVRLVSTVALASLVWACAAGPDIRARHDPPYRAEAHASTISVTATSQRGIDRIVVELVRGDLVVCQLGDLSSMYPCRENAQSQTFICDYSAETLASATFGAGVASTPKTATCPVTVQLDELALVSYRATAYDAAGGAASTNFVTYSGGVAPPGTSPVMLAARARAPRAGVRIAIDDGDPPAIPRPGAGDVLRPIRVELDSSDEPADGRVGFLSGRLALAFMPDADWEEDYRGFSDTTGEIVSDVYFRPLSGGPVPSYAEDYYLWRQRFALWAGPVGAGPGGEPDDCYTRTFTNWATVARAVTDGQVIVHKLRFAGGVDCTGAGPASWGTVWAGAHPANPPSLIFVHESGHFLHCLADEYSTGGGLSCSDPPNTFVTHEQCVETATALGFPANWCRQIGFVWHVRNGQPEIMAGLEFPPGSTGGLDWQDTNHHVIQRRMAACLLGSC